VAERVGQESGAARFSLVHPAEQATVLAKYVLTLLGVVGKGNQPVKAAIMSVSFLQRV